MRRLQARSSKDLRMPFVPVFHSNLDPGAPEKDFRRQLTLKSTGSLTLFASSFAANSI